MNEPRKAPDIVAEMMQHASRLDDKEAQVARGAFLERLGRENVQRTGPHRAYAWAPLAAAAALILYIFAWPTAKLEYTVAGAEEDNGYVQALAKSSVVVEFTDKTLLTLAPGARLRVLETDEDGARVSLEEGEISARVTPTSTGAWRFGAGPFQVRVTGTRFVLHWAPETEQLRVELLEGSVEVKGYSDSGTIALRAGQSFFGDARTRTMQVSERSSNDKTQARQGKALFPVPATPKASAIVADNREVSAAEESMPGRGKAETLDQASSAATPPSWTNLVSRGEFDHVVKDAQERGVASCLATCSAADLGALADAARYSGQGDLASKSLLAVRSRFFGNERIRAAFLLGRLYEGLASQAKALSWYETSLSESPTGSFAGESLAGKMRTVLALEGKAAAAQVAIEYLRRYPEGVHALAAQKLTRP